jgi:hypothetical protein
MVFIRFQMRLSVVLSEAQAAVVAPCRILHARLFLGAQCPPLPHCRAARNKAATR